MSSRKRLRVISSLKLLVMLSLLPGYSPNYANQSRYQLIKICQTFATPTWFTIALNLRSTNSTSSDHAVCQEFESEFNVYIILIHIISTLPQLNWHLTPIFVTLCHDVVIVNFIHRQKSGNTKIVFTLIHIFVPHWLWVRS